MTDPEYTIAVCNYNMADTLEESLRSILDQLNKKFEVLVIDDGSTDGSQEILDKLEKEYEIFRWVEGNNNNLAEARNHSFEEAEGEYILESLDVDDKYEPVIQDFVKIFEKLNDEIEGDFYLSSNGLNMAPKSLLLEVPYRSLGYGEDKDLWRRLLARDVFIPLKIEQPYTTIGYKYSKLERFKISYESTKVDFRSGVSFKSFISWKFRNLEYVDDYFKLLISPIAYIKATIEGVYSLPDGYQKMGRLFRELEKKEKTLRLLEADHDIDVKRDISEQGEKLLYT
jgi:glycosyltransferase involved in cell wall biosynthesis